jgi:hypothetical protein
MPNIYPKSILDKLRPQYNVPYHFLIVGARPFDITEATTNHLNITEVESISYFLPHTERLATEPLVKM